MHVGGCHMAGGVPRDVALRALTEGVNACGHCRPMLRSATWTAEPDRAVGIYQASLEGVWPVALVAAAYHATHICHHTARGVPSAEAREPYGAARAVWVLACYATAFNRLGKGCRVS
ncbi:DUF6233 domain-containing protein [Streptomyces sp. NPDC001292]|uniref:DUF6233 domain-containing protein n=1 Tax=Streptomyces sp. NPDC001292 TaxID=3364558 RepID=UPI003675D476